MNNSLSVCHLEVILDTIKLVSGYFNLDADIWVERDGKDEDYLATVENLGGNMYNIQYNAEFLSTCTRDELVGVTSHEVVHIKQFEQDGLILEEGMRSICGQTYKGDYWFSPWEIEARGYEAAFVHYYQDLKNNS